MKKLVSPTFEPNRARKMSNTSGTAIANSQDVLVSARIIVIMPCYNEEGRVGKVVSSVKENIPSATVLVIDDASSDNSAYEAEKAGAITLRHACNLGYGAALETGYLFASSNGYEIVLQMDSDGQHLAEELPTILQPILKGHADIVLGSRHMRKKTNENMPLLRRLGQYFFSGLIFLITGLKLTDPTSGFQALNRRAIRLFSSGVFPCDYPDSDIIIMAHMAGLQILEVPVAMKARCGGKSMHSGLKPIYYGMKMLLAMFIVLLNVGSWRKWQKILHNNPSGTRNIGSNKN